MTQHRPAAGWWPLVISGTIMAVAALGAGGYYLLTTPLSRAGMGMDQCTVSHAERDRLAFIMNWSDPLCMVEAWDTLEQFGFDKADLERSADEGQAVARGEWSVRAVDADTTTANLQITVRPAP